MKETFFKCSSKTKATAVQSLASLAPFPVHLCKTVFENANV